MVTFYTLQNDHLERDILTHWSLQDHNIFATFGQSINIYNLNQSCWVPHQKNDIYDQHKLL